MTKLKDYAPFADPVEPWEISRFLFSLIQGAVKKRLSNQFESAGQNLFGDRSVEARYGNLPLLSKFDPRVYELVENEVRRIPEKFLWNMYRTFHDWELDEEADVKDVDVIRGVSMDICDELHSYKGIPKEYFEWVKEAVLKQAYNEAIRCSQKYELSFDEMVSDVEHSITAREMAFWTEYGEAVRQLIAHQLEFMPETFYSGIADPYIAEWFGGKEAVVIQLFDEVGSKYHFIRYFYQKTANVVSDKIKKEVRSPLEELKQLDNHCRTDEMDDAKISCWKTYENWIQDTLDLEFQNIPKCFMEVLFLNTDYWTLVTNGYKPEIPPGKIDVTEKVRDEIWRYICREKTNIANGVFGNAINSAIEKLKVTPGVENESLYLDIGEQMHAEGDYPSPWYEGKARVWKTIGDGFRCVPETILRALCDGCQDEDGNMVGAETDWNSYGRRELINMCIREILQDICDQAYDEYYELLESKEDDDYDNAEDEDYDDDGDGADAEEMNAASGDAEVRGSDPQ